MLSYRDGKTATVAMFETPGEGQHRSIATNGKIDASVNVGAGSRPTMDEYTMTFAAALPLAFNPKPAEVAVIGFGSGMTAHAFLGSDRIERLDVIEIEPYMVEAARHFETALTLQARDRTAARRDRYDLLVGHADACRWSTRFDEMMASADEAILIAAELGDPHSLVLASAIANEGAIWQIRVYGVVDEAVVAAMRAALDALPPGDSEDRARLMLLRMNVKGA